MTPPRDPDPLEEPHDDDPDFAEVEAPPLESTDIAEDEALVFAERVGRAP